MNVPKILKLSKNQFLDKEILSKELLLSPNDLEQLKAVLLHESLFSFYKSFYNYVMAKNLQLSGDAVWSKITLYYSKFYVARSVNTLLGKQSYIVRSDSKYFIPEIFEMVKTKQFKELLKKYNNNKEKIDWENERKNYTIVLDINLDGESRVQFSNKGINSHEEVFGEYHSDDIGKLGFPQFIFNDYSYKDLIEERNFENYSFDGYRRLDFNLHEQSFSSWYGDGISKKEADLVYDIESATYLSVFQNLYHLFKDMSIYELPIEKYKFNEIVQQSLINKKLERKLLDLINTDFPMRNCYLDEMNAYYSS